MDVHYVTGFLELSEQISPSSLMTITRIYIYSGTPSRVRRGDLPSEVKRLWTQFWDLIMTKLPGVIDVRVVFYLSTHCQVMSNFDEEWLEPILNARRLKNITFTIKMRNGRNEGLKRSAAHMGQELERKMSGIGRVIVLAA